MQFANTLPFSQHLVPRYSASPAIPPKFLNLGMAKKNSHPQTLHQVSATRSKVKVRAAQCSGWPHIMSSSVLVAGDIDSAEDNIRPDHKLPRHSGEHVPSGQGRASGSAQLRQLQDDQ